jgi:hypothetical protein
MGLCHVDHCAVSVSSAKPAASALRPQVAKESEKATGRSNLWPTSHAAWVVVLLWEVVDRQDPYMYEDSLH